MAGDLVAAMDQAEKTAAETARPIAAFHRALIEGKVSPVVAANLTMLYGTRLIAGKGA